MSLIQNRLIIWLSPHTAQCKMALKNNTNIECNKEGNFKPLQCDPIVSAINESESGGARSRSKKRDPMMCRCVEMLSGDTIVSSEVRVEPGMKRPNCRFRGKIIFIIDKKLTFLSATHPQIAKFLGPEDEAEEAKKNECTESNMEILILMQPTVEVASALMEMHKLSAGKRHTSNYTCM